MDDHQNYQRPSRRHRARPSELALVAAALSAVSVVLPWYSVSIGPLSWDVNLIDLAGADWGGVRFLGQRLASLVEGAAVTMMVIGLAVLLALIGRTHYHASVLSMLLLIAAPLVFVQAVSSALDPIAPTGFFQTYMFEMQMSWGPSIGLLFSFAAAGVMAVSLFDSRWMSVSVGD